MNYVLARAEKTEKKIEIYHAEAKDRNVYRWEDVSKKSNISSIKKTEKINKWLNTEMGEKFLKENKKEESLL